MDSTDLGLIDIGSVHKEDADIGTTWMHSVNEPIITDPNTMTVTIKLLLEAANRPRHRGRVVVHNTEVYMVSYSHFFQLMFDCFCFKCIP